MQNKLTKSLVFAILLLAAFFRLYGVNWDQNQHLHPDERFLTMVAGGLEWPKTIKEYLDTDSSPLNPHNKGNNFFVYGTFPIFFTKWIAESLNLGDYNNITLVGRQLSALFDLGTVMLVFLIGKQINSNYPISTNKYQSSSKKNIGNWKLEIGNWFIPLWGMFFYSISVLPIQLSHFFAVDTYLTFFITLSFYLLTKIILNSKFSILNWIILGMSFGLALASKISAAIFFPIIGISFIFLSLKNKNKIKLLVSCFLFLVSCFFTLRFSQPYLFAKSYIISFHLNNKVLDNWKQLKSFDDPQGWFPPGVQWINTKPYIFPLKNMIYWGLGFPLGILSVFAVLYLVFRILYLVYKRKNLYKILDTRYKILLLSLLWILLLFTYQGAQFSKNMRYFLPIYPFLAIISSFFIYQRAAFIRNKFQNTKTKLKIGIWAMESGNSIGLLVYLIIGLLVFIYPFSFLSIYSRAHTRIAASQWIYENITPDAKLSAEHWDDPLPLGLPYYPPRNFTHIEFPLYGADSEEKWADMAKRLEKVDYIILSSNRLYGSITSAPSKYPISTRYYQKLFDGSLGFTNVAQFTSRPNIPFPTEICLHYPGARYGTVDKFTTHCKTNKLSFVDDYADESFTVYDHPKVFIFQKVYPVNYFAIIYQGK